jgi:CheY-like chemotaxis protein
VIDSGIGIAKADVERVFDDFVTLDSSYAREVEGTGLGLGIVRRLVSVMDGEVGVESDMGEGSVFWLRLPLPPTLLSREVPVEAGSRDPAPSDTSAMSVLVVEDNEINRMVVREMLAAAGCRSTEATDGERGVKAAAAQPFDLILMDISMPRLDGIVATGQIRNGEGPNATTPIVALTAHALPADIQRFQAAGMTDVLVKPLTRDRLMAVLGDVRVDLADHAAPAPAMSELVEALGAEKALEISRRATGEIRAGHVTLLAMIESEDTLRDVEQLAHKLAGLAALVGLTEAHAHLRALEAAAGAGVVQSARSELVALTEHLSDG